MKWFGKAALMALMAAGSQAAQAADWWWVSGDAHDRAAWFVDAESVVRTGPNASLTVQLVTRDGTVRQRVRQVRCDTPRPDAVQRFACATDNERMATAAMLGPISPRVAAHAIFVSANPTTAQAAVPQG